MPKPASWSGASTMTAGPDDPNFKGAWEGDSWKIGGGSMWDAVAVDPKRDLMIFAIGNPNPDLYGGFRKGNNLYTVSMVAVHAKTGKLAWYYQQIPHDVWDLDSAAPTMLFDVLDKNGKTVEAAAEANKNGHLYIVNRDNGKLIRRSDAFVKQSESIVKMIPPDDTARVYYPANHGGAMWQPPAYSPLTHYFYTMGINEPHIYKVKPSKPWVPGTPEVGQQFGNAVPTEAERKALESQMIPNSGNLSAIDVNSGKIAWQYPSDHLMFGGVLATASNLVFAGRGERQHHGLRCQERRKTLVVSYGHRCLYAAHHLPRKRRAISGCWGQRLPQPGDPDEARRPPGLR